MKNIRLLSCLVLMFNLAACSSSTATTSFRDGFDFSLVESYSTYGRNSAFGDLQNMSDSTRNTIELAIEQGFDKNGFRYKTFKKADIIIAYHVLNNRIGELERYNEQVKYCRYCLRVGDTSRAKIKSQLRPGSLIIDIIDPESQRSVWRSIYPLGFNDDDNSREMQKKISRAVDIMLLDYPKGKSLSAVTDKNKEIV